MPNGTAIVTALETNNSPTAAVDNNRFLPVIYDHTPNNKQDNFPKNLPTLYATSQTTNLSTHSNAEHKFSHGWCGSAVTFSIFKNSVQFHLLIAILPKNCFAISFDF